MYNIYITCFGWHIIHHLVEMFLCLTWSKILNLSIYGTHSGVHEKTSHKTTQLLSWPLPLDIPYTSQRHKSGRRDNLTIQINYVPSHKIDVLPYANVLSGYWEQVPYANVIRMSCHHDILKLPSTEQVNTTNLVEDII
jgi:hypothetical protein